MAKNLDKKNLQTNIKPMDTRKILGIVIAVAIVIAAIVVPLVVFLGDDEDDGPYTLTILHNNDGESKLLPKDEFPGIARFIAQLKQLQEDDSETDGTITLTSGDNFLASKEFNISMERGVPYFDSTALSGVYDAMALGNHDFDFGPDVTAEFIRGFSPSIPFLSSNIDVSNEPELVKLEEEGNLAKSVTIRKGGKDIGVIGAVTPSLPNISSPRNVEVGADVARAVNVEAERLMEDGVEIIILVSHLQDVDEELELVKSLRNVDVVIAGGGDELLRNDGDTCLADSDQEPRGSYPLIALDIEENEIPVITAPGGYRCIGVLKATFDEDGILTSHTGQSLGVPLDKTPDSEVQEDVVDPLSRALESLDTDIVGTSEVDLQGAKPQIRSRETNLGNLLSDAILSTASSRADSFGVPTPVAGFQNGGGIRNDSLIDAGNISVSTTFDVAPFGNGVVIMTIPRQTLKDMLETAYDGLPDADGQFAQVSGLRVEYDDSRPARAVDRDNDCVITGSQGERVRSITLSNGERLVSNGQVVSGDDVTIAITDFLAKGGDCYPLADFSFTRMGLTYQQALQEHIEETLNGRITANDYPEGGSGRIVSVG